ncbi:hypothetical protein GCM10010193_05700 [Kitasatospora atroaurantiaca]|uniref:histidine kinase n=1 Tax=Kitasatospora atroaurantiaca TaxID=285545 RepID=A0A561EW63_9ACTN|nr:ATP-binding protein [Kitasatospora atroaurantiaca]TWE19874.1 histidine kinase/DNA gyrase B/HSP90-like ATPase [Kitasatospora atroaurantiaca]
MRARTRPERGAHQRPNGRTVLWAAAGILVGAGTGAAATTAVPTVHRAAVAGTVGGALVLWCALVLVAVWQADRSRRMHGELATVRHELMDTRAQAAALHADLSATHSAAAALRAALATAQAEADGANADLAAARADLATAEARTAELRAAAEAGQQGREEVERLSAAILPEVVKRLRAGSSVDSALAGHTGPAHAGLLRTVAEEIGRGERQRAAALAVCATAAGRVQALATSMHAELRDMQHRHGEDVLGDLLSLDHATAQAGRMADSIAVLTGARSGRRWTKPIGVESILRGALGRIGAYQRVRLHSASTAAVAGFAAEGVMHALAELLDNAANFSAPPAEVHVYVEEVHSGLVITVEDGGLGLSESWLRRAERAVSAEPLDLTMLSAGTRLGLAVVGALARKHGLSVSFRPSARGGTGVVMLIPEQLVTHPTPALAKAVEAARTQQPAAEPTRAVLEPRRSSPATADNGLPQRRRGQTLAASQPSASNASKPSASLPSGSESSASQSSAPLFQAQPVRPAQPVRADAAVSAARFGAFRRALQQGPDTTDALPKDDS